MQSMQRSFGKLMNKGPGDNAKVAVLLTDYEDADKVLVKLIDGNKSFRDSWVTLVTHQLAIATEYQGLYDPIVGASDGHGTEPLPTPELQLQRTYKMQETYKDLRDEMLQEIAEIEPLVIKPAVDAHEAIQPIRRTIKKRENKRLDYEKQQDKVNKLSRKFPRSPKEETNLAKAESDMQILGEEFTIADDHLRTTLPPLINACFSIIPPLIGCHILVQNKLLGLYYTFVHNYCEDMGFPSPPPPMEQVIAEWEASFKPIQIQVEKIPIIMRGKAAHMPMKLNQLPPSTIPAPPVSRRPSGLIPGLANGNAPARNLRIPSTSSQGPPSREPSPQPSPSGRVKPEWLTAGHLKATDFTTASVLGKPAVETPGAVSPGQHMLRKTPTAHVGGQGGDYFPNNAALTRAATTDATYAPVMSPMGIVAKKKAPPPPPPTKPKPKPKPREEYVVALYDFAGEGAGDLSFREGDRIKIVKKTETDLDWWDGEVNGVRGSFPANYCRAV